MEVAAIYARKSVFTEKGESIDNQIERCKAYALMKGWDIKIYFDEDYSGKDLNRPQFQEMLKDIEHGKIQNVIFYRLDRVSRKVSDIINFIENLNHKGIGFISLSENFDTTTPMGRAMLLITAVFAQLERETIAERVRDNMMDLAKKGRWNGGLPPFGYESKRITSDDGKKTTLLIKSENGTKIIEQMYQWASEGISLRGIAENLNNRGIKSRKGPWSLGSVSRLLHNPFYCHADKDAFDYFTRLGMQVIGDRDAWDGTKGVMVYNKSNKAGEKYWHDKCDWIVSVGLHEGMIPGKLFEQVEHGLDERQVKGNTPSQKGILSAGILKCGCCGKSMNVLNGSKFHKETGERITYYRCRSKVIKDEISCENTNVRTDKLDQTVIEIIKNIASNPDIVKTQINDLKEESTSKNRDLEKEKNLLKTEIQKHNGDIKDLLDLMLNKTLPKAVIQEKIEEIQQKVELLQEDLDELSSQQKMNEMLTVNADIVQENLLNFSKQIESASVKEKRDLINKIIESIVWTQGDIKINIWGTGVKKKSCL